MATRLADPEVTAVLRTTEGLEVEFSRTHTWLVPYLVLRDACPSCFHPRSGNRVSSVASSCHALLVEDAGVIRGQGPNRLLVLWEDKTSSEFESAWLYAKCFRGLPDSGASQDAADAKKPWGAERTEGLPEFDYKELVGDARTQAAFLRALIHQEGVAIIRGGGARPGIVRELAATLFCQAPSEHASFRLKLDHQRELNGVPLRTDRAYLSVDQGFLGISCTKHVPPTPGGASQVREQSGGAGLILVDGLHVAKTLEAEDKETFATLTELPATFARTSEATVGAGQVEEWAERLVLGRDLRGHITQVVFDDQHRTVWDGAPLHGLRFLEAWRAMANLLYRPDVLVSQKLQQGDMLFLDTRRVLWGKPPGGGEAGGEVLLEGSFLDRDAVLSADRVLRRTLYGQTDKVVK